MLIYASVCYHGCLIWPDSGWLGKSIPTGNYLTATVITEVGCGSAGTKCVTILWVVCFSFPKLVEGVAAIALEGFLL